MKHFQPITRPLSLKSTELSNPQFAQQIISKYHQFNRFYLGFPFIFRQSQTRFFWRITQQNISLSLQLGFERNLNLENHQKIIQQTQNELFSRIIQRSLTTLIQQRFSQWFRFSFPRQSVQSSNLIQTQFNPSFTILSNIAPNSALTLSINPLQVEWLQSPNPTMTLFSAGNASTKQSAKPIALPQFSDPSSSRKVTNHLLLLNHRSRKTAAAHSTSLASDFFLFTQNRKTEALFASGQIRSESSFLLTHRHTVLSNFSTNTRITINDQSLSDRLVPFEPRQPAQSLELANQQPTINRRPSLPSFDSPLALPYFRTSVPVTQELAKLKADLVTLQTTTQRLSSQNLSPPPQTPLATGEVNRLAEQVYQVIERKIKIENERRGR